MKNPALERRGNGREQKFSFFKLTRQVFSIYHKAVAARKGTDANKTPAKNTADSAQGAQAKKPPEQRIKRYWTILFWLVFVIVIYGFFLFNREAITNSVQIIRNERMAQRMARENIPAPAPPVIVQPAPIPPQAPPAAPTQPATAPVTPPVTPAPLPAPIATPPVQPEPQEAIQPLPPQAEPRPVELWERTLYFTQVDRGGIIFRSGVSRRLPVSNTPMTDVLHALIDGPSDEERRRGIISLIPPDTQILSATVRDGTAYISFSEDFLYNTYGADGYIGQLREIVYTVTEFSNVSNVQILIEGHRVDILGKGIWIGSPIRRGMI